MLPDRVALAESGAEPRSRSESGFARVLIVVAIAALVSALGLWWIADTSTDLPALKDLGRESREFYLPVLQGEMPGETLGLNHAPGARVWTTAWLNWNGHWDA